LPFESINSWGAMEHTFRKNFIAMKKDFSIVKLSSEAKMR
jgi:hypothetical protein